MKKAASATPNTRLVEERLKRRWSQQEVADRIGTTPVNVSRWERGMSSPGAYFRYQLCTLFETNAEDLGIISKVRVASSEQTLPTEIQHHESTPFVPVTPQLPWNVPYRRNPFFTGRENIIKRLHDILHSEKEISAQPLAISGMGGIGKTQVAIEYAYRYRDSYSAVLWVRADSQENLLSDFVAIAHIVHQSEPKEHDQSHAIEDVKCWLQAHSNWLLILDNVEALTMAHNFLPFSHNGHILLTTRTQITGGLAQRIDLEKMGREEGALFFLRRSKYIAPSAHLEDTSEILRSRAGQISHIMDGLPLALDQAGAYIEETMCDISDYLNHYQSERGRLLHLRGEVATDHPASVSVTFSLAFEEVKQCHLAVHLLRLCAFLHPDAIPEEILIEGISEFGTTLHTVTDDPLAFDTAIKELRKFSLLQRNPENKTFTVHRLVQAVLMDSMDEETQRQWAERTIRAVHHAFPDGDFTTWQRCQRCFPHVQVCATFIEQWKIVSLEAAQLLQEAGCYIYEQASLYPQAETLLQQSLKLYQQLLGPEQSAMARSLFYLGKMFQEQAKHERAESQFREAITIYEQTLGPMHPDVAQSLIILAVFYIDLSKYELAEPLLQRALHVYEQSSELNSLQTAQNLNTLALSYYYQGKYKQAEALFQRVHAIYERILEPGHPTIAESFTNLGEVCIALENYTQAQHLVYQALSIYTQSLEPGHPMIGVIINILGLIYYHQGDYEQAEALFQQALNIREQALGLESPCFAETLNNLAELFYVQGNYTQAEHYCRHALAIYKKVWGEDHLATAHGLSTQAKLYRVQGEYEQAELYFQEAHTIRERLLGPKHPDVTKKLEEWITLKSTLECSHT